MIRKISIADITIRRSSRFSEEALPFRIGIEMAKHLDQLGVSAIEVGPVGRGRFDYLLVKSLASTVQKAALVVPVDLLDAESPAKTWDAVKEAKHPRLQVYAPISTVQMEYFCHKKASAVLDCIRERVAASAALCPEVEFTAGDFTRSDPEFAEQTVQAAVEAGATIVTICDAAGDMLPDEFYAAVKRIKDILPDGIRLGVFCSNKLFLADACAVAAVRAGADEIKTYAMGGHAASLEHFPLILHAKSELCGGDADLRMTELQHAVYAIRQLCEDARSRTCSGSLAKVETVENTAEDEEIIPETYRLDSYLINSGNVITSTCHLRLQKGKEMLESVCVGNGPVDASFQAVEKLLGRSYELDDFKIRSVTEGREAMGETEVLLRYDGKIYSGKGVSTDIVGSSILAYINAANKIAYEEEQA
ncbi:MAG: alpha-isopropylmalate synthase regulatory domain-containing protein [Bacteroidia bacterium]|nr:alpha-isopropylmalate synthase regulatory domain-containing protein [Bacteroidia bacterium]